MENNQLTQWVQDQKQKGFSKETIQTHLENQNYNKQEINKAIEIVFLNQTINTNNNPQQNNISNNSTKIISEKENKTNLIFLIILIILTILISIYYFKYK
jgi:ABC-type transport system involved in multi-copper enzyme maturation permease subunit